MTTIDSSQAVSQNTSANILPNSPPPLSQSGIMAVLAAFLSLNDTTNKMIDSYDTMLTNFSKQLSIIGTGMYTQLQKDSAAIANTDPSNATAVAAANDKYTNDQINFQNQMTPYNTQTNSWTDGVKQLTTDESNYYQYCQGPVQILTNLSNRM